MKLSIIIVNWNTRELLGKCLESLLIEYENFFGPQSPMPSEIIVVDNASNDGSVQFVRDHFPEVILIENRENLGFAKANNQAFDISRGQYILLLNPDTEVKQGALKTLVDFIDANPQVGAAGSLLLNPDGTIQTSCHPAPTLIREFWLLFHLDKLFPYGIYPTHKWSLDQPREVEVLKGACMLIRSDVFNQAGGLDEGYFMYSEEVDLCFQIRKKGWSIYWVPSAKVIHYGGQSTQQIGNIMFLFLYKTKITYFRKNHNFLSAKFYKLILLIAAVGRLLVSPMAYLEQSSQRQRHIELARSYLRLVRELPGW